MPSYKLYYFDGRGRGELIRMICLIGGIQIEDVKVSEDEWETMQKDSPWGVMPFLEVDGVRIGESRAISRLLAKEAGIAGKNAVEQCQADAIVDVNVNMLDYFYEATYEEDEEDKAELIKDFKKEAKRFLPRLEKALCSNNGGNGYFVGNDLTWADLCFFTSFENMDSLVADKLKKQPKLVALIERVRKHDKLAAYIAGRPPADF